MCADDVFPADETLTECVRVILVRSRQDRAAVSVALKAHLGQSFRLQGTCPVAVPFVSDVSSNPSVALSAYTPPWREFAADLARLPELTPSE